MSGQTTPPPRLPARPLQVIVAALLLGALAGCSVPREADLTTDRSAASSNGVGAATAPAVAASSLAAGTPTPAPSPPVRVPTAPPSPLPSPAAVRPPTPVAVPGYTLSKAPSSVGNPLNGVKDATDVFGAQTVRSVRKGDTDVGLLFLFAVRPQYVQDRSVASVVVQRITSGITRGGMPVRMHRFGDQQVCVGSSASKGTIVVWLANGVLAVVVGGSDADTVTGYARAYVAAS